MSTKTKNLILIFITVTIASAIPAILFSKYIEAIVFMCCHTLIRPQFDMQYHHIIPRICRAITAVVLFFGIVFTLPFEISLLSAIPLNYFIAWVGFQKAKADYCERKSQELQTKLAVLSTRLEDPRATILNICREKKLSHRDTKIAELYYCDGYKPKDIWLWLCEHKEFEPIEWETVYQTLWRIGKKIK